MVESSAAFGLYRKYTYAPSSSTAATPIAASVCSRLVMFAPNAILTHRRDYEWNRLYRERRRRLRLGLQREFRDFLSFGLHQIGPRQLHVLDERRRLERLHEARERLNVDGVSDDLELDLLRRREERVGAGLLCDLLLERALARRLGVVGAVGCRARFLGAGVRHRHALRLTRL